MATARKREQSIRLEIVAHIPTAFRHCMHCERLMDAALGETVRQEMVEEYPAEFLEEFDRLLLWIDELTARWGSRLQVRVVDPQSPEGLWKSLRYRVRRYPTFIVEGRHRIVGWDKEALYRALDEAGAAE
ncbi:MAG TPA: hypothetical protein ENK08_05635 [Chloroflexi bacterium]|nr:hypothetical protein [Chloroflexota bacterium]